MIDYHKLEIGRQTRSRSKKRPSLEVVGFDSETTTDGDIFLLADSFGEYIWKPTLRDCLDFLFLRSHHQKLNLFYNLEFDVRGIIKMLRETRQKILVAEGKLEVNLPYRGRNHPVVYNLRYCKDRMYVVKGKTGTVPFFDLAQFFSHRSLANAAKTFVSDYKEPVTDYDFTPESVEERKDEILKYCLKDCELVRKLGELTKEKFESLGIYESKYISPAFLSERFFNKRCYVPRTVDLIKRKRIVREQNTNPVEYAFRAYAGGWIEIQKRGHFEKLYHYDINSAYPFVMGHLVDPNLGSWVYSKEWLKGSTYAFVRCSVCVDPTVLGMNWPPLLHISPISYLFPSKGMYFRVYPVGAWECYLSKSEYLFVRDHLGHVEIIDGWFFFSDPDVPRPLRDQIEKLYRRKHDLKKEIEKDPKALVEYQSVKLLLNSLYGKTIQRVPVKRLDLTGNILIDHFKTGNFFNPIWASVITSEVRLKIAEGLLQNPYSCAAITTDGVLTTEPLKLDFGDALGSWSQEPPGETVIVLPGAYGIKGQRPENKVRGFAGIFKDHKAKDWFDYLSRHKKESFIEVVDRRPVSLMEAFLQTERFGIHDINRFVEFRRKYNLREWRRHWKGDVTTCGDLLDQSLTSCPWHIDKLWEGKERPDLRQYEEKAVDLTDTDKIETIKMVRSRGGIKNSPVLKDHGDYSEILLSLRRKQGLSLDEMASELRIDIGDLWESIKS